MRANPQLAATIVFPARAGMSLKPPMSALPEPCVPRASGDEPIRTLGLGAQFLCSPRERG